MIIVVINLQYCGTLHNIYDICISRNCFSVPTSLSLSLFIEESYGKAKVMDELLELKSVLRGEDQEREDLERREVLLKTSIEQEETRVSRQASLIFHESTSLLC